MNRPYDDGPLVAMTLPLRGAAGWDTFRTSPPRFTAAAEGAVAPPLGSGMRRWVGEEKVAVLSSDISGAFRTNLNTLSDDQSCSRLMHRHLALSGCT